MNSFNQLLIELYCNQENPFVGCPTPRKLHLLFNLVVLLFYLIVGLLFGCLD